MKRIYALIAALAIAFSLTGCVDKNETSDRFEIVEINNCDVSMFRRQIIFRDKETNVLYLYMSGSNRAGITVLVNADGTPKLWEG